MPLSQLSAFAGLDLSKPRIMGVVNVTPDSFSDGGDFIDAGTAVSHGLALLEAGADILDVGGESTRPGAVAVSQDEEMRRVLPVIRGLADAGAPISVDTRHAAVMAAALEAGAALVNDVTALEGDADSLRIVADSGCSVVLMHKKGEPDAMQENPVYGDVVAEVLDYLQGRIATCAEAGIPLDKISIDPGIGFGKTIDHNLALLAHLDRFLELGRAVVLGTSRKSFIPAITARSEPPKERLGGSLASGLYGAIHGAHILRVHDVAATRQMLEVWRAIEGAG